MTSCCSKVLCHGCDFANDLRVDEGNLKNTCLFCREASPKTQEECDKRRMKRIIKANDPVAMSVEGREQLRKGAYRRAFDYFTKAAELGDVDAHVRIAAMYHHDQVGKKEEGRYVHHLEEAAIAGHPEARYNLGIYESNNGNIERAVKHWVISATQGYDDSMNLMMEMFKGGCVSKEVLAATLRAHQAAVEATKSPQRELAEDFKRFKKIMNRGMINVD